MVSRRTRVHDATSAKNKRAEAEYGIMGDSERDSLRIERGHQRADVAQRVCLLAACRRVNVTSSDYV